MKVNYKYLGFRIISFPIKLLFSLIWSFLIAILISLKWLKNGGQELYYGNEFGGTITTLIDSNEKLIKALAEKSVITCKDAEIMNKAIT